MAYIGRGLDNGVRNQFVFAATQGQTSFSGADSDGKTLAMTDILYTDCYQNGVKLKPTTDYTVSLTTLTLISAASLNDVINIVSFDIFAVPDTVPASTGGTFTGGVTFSTKLNVPTATTAPSSPSEGDVWFNTSASTVSSIATKTSAVYNGTKWRQMSEPEMVATGGTKTTSGGYTIHTFTSSGTFAVSGASAMVDYLIVAGGGGGGATRAGGGGGGGMIVSTNQTLNIASYTVTIGAGGAGQASTGSDGANGANSVLGSFTANGGGAGGGQGRAGVAGGSGGGGSDGGSGASSNSASQGNAGGGSAGDTGGGGGGGAGGAGSQSGSLAGGAGGAALANAFSGSSVGYSGGAGGGSRDGNAAGTGGSGAGNGGIGNSTPATVGTANRGGGGGGGARNGSENDDGAAGGSGIVIIRYLT